MPQLRVNNQIRSAHNRKMNCGLYRPVGGQHQVKNDAAAAFRGSSAGVRKASRCRPTGAVAASSTRSDESPAT